MTFREFMEGLPNNATPEYAKAEYDRYLADFYGNEIKADFERKKGDPELRKRYHPTEIQKSIEAKTKASKAAANFVKEKGLPAGKHIPVGPYFYEEDIKEDVSLEENGKPEDFRRAFPVTDDSRAQYFDLKIVKRLIKKLDAECGIESNEILAGMGSDDDAHDDMDIPKDEAMAGGDDDDDDEDEDIAIDDDGPAAPVDESVKQKSDEPTKVEDDDALNAKFQPPPSDFDVHNLDMLLQYLWVVHGVDYYSGKEYGFESDYARKGHFKRVLRPSQIKAITPSENNEEENAADGDAGKPHEASLHDLQVHEAKLCTRWLNRISRGPPSVRFVKESQVEEDLEKFIESQIIKHEENKWGNKLSNKLFVAKEFVVKHIKNKHAHVLEAEKERILESIYRENYTSAKEREQRRTAAGGRGRGGRGGRGGGRGGMSNQMMYIDFGGRGQMTPVMVLPVQGARGGRGGFRGGRGGRGRGAFGGQGYYDLDAPQNNRAMLDYGDL
jgi:hypothetical protein